MASTQSKIRKALPKIKASPSIVPDAPETIVPDTPEAVDDEHAKVWGCKNIALVIGRTDRQTFYLCEQKLLPVQKVGDQWVGLLKQLRAFPDRDYAIPPRVKKA